MFSLNSFHDLVIAVGLQRIRGGVLPVLPAPQPSFCSAQRYLCASAASAQPFLPPLPLPDLQFRALVILRSLPPSGSPITRTISLSASHSILCLCLFNTRWSCLPPTGCLRGDAERFPVDGMERQASERR